MEQLKPRDTIASLQAPIEHKIYLIRSNTLAYFAAFSKTEKKSFVTFSDQIDDKYEIGLEKEDVYARVS
jgi:hypothetical protein